ncbi:hypothetical protein FB45DRAFT_877358 [Roridomyces roridus]|uniref:Uncharacterized protein n=1 Tax=Roridomyces roridus TaxID=1738132 RepID=A0AAD7FAF2_9AGAR|nr:hypothetical protein FB45DRAFT_877358 [Roridomyces roridus]
MSINGDRDITHANPTPAVMSNGHPLVFMSKINYPIEIINYGVMKITLLFSRTWKLVVCERWFQNQLDEKQTNLRTCRVALSAKRKVDKVEKSKKNDHDGAVLEPSSPFSMKYHESNAKRRSPNRPLSKKYGKSPSTHLKKSRYEDVARARDLGLDSAVSADGDEAWEEISRAVESRTDFRGIWLEPRCVIDNGVVEGLCLAEVEFESHGILGRCWQVSVVRRARVRIPTGEESTYARRRKIDDIPAKMLKPRAPDNIAGLRSIAEQAWAEKSRGEWTCLNIGVTTTPKGGRGRVESWRARGRKRSLKRDGGCVEGGELGAVAKGLKEG